jgi:hypothetical protein
VTPPPHTELWQPTTFLERGVAVPFTTPVLAGARARPGASGIDLVVPHPAGVRGVYIMGWSALPDFCAATLHDVMLSERISTLKAVTPSHIRTAARAIAGEGAAGRGAREAAHVATEADRHELLLTNILLLQLLVEQTQGSCPPPAELDRRAKAAIFGLATKLQRAAPAITNDIELLSSLFAGLGVGASRGGARCARQVNAIQAMMAEVRPLADRYPGPTGLAASLVLGAAEVTLALARRTLGEAQARLDDFPALLAAWAADDKAVASVLARPDWLLDGWEHICLVWHLADPARRRAAISEMALMVPVIPKEASEWLGLSIDEGEHQRLRKIVFSFEDWRSGNLVFDLIGRNELIRTLAA